MRGNFCSICRLFVLCIACLAATITGQKLQLLLQIGPPPGLGDKRKNAAANQGAEVARLVHLPACRVKKKLARLLLHSTSNWKGFLYRLLTKFFVWLPGLHQQYQTSRRTQHGGAPTRTYRVLEVPRPPNTGQVPPGGWPEKGFDNYNFPTFSIDDLKEDSKTAWPEESEVRDEDITKWGWGDEEEATASANASAPAEEAVPSTPTSMPQRNMPRPGRSNIEGANEHRAPRLSQVEEQTLQQVDQRNADLAAVMTRLRLQELRQQHGQINQAAAYQHPPGHQPPAGV